MKVIHITTTDYGGAYRAAQNISTSMNLLGVDSKVFVREKRFEEDVIPYFGSGMPLFISRTKNCINLVLSKNGMQNDVLGTDISRHPLIREADAIFLHWVNSFISYSSLSKLMSLEKPIFWVMHDMWPLTGGCHYDKECSGYVDDCRSGVKCGIPKSKKNILYGSNIQFIGPSNWITDCARKSSLLSRCECSCIFNPVDTNLFEPLEQKRTSPQKVIAFCAMSPQNQRKGFDLLSESLMLLDRNMYSALIIGDASKIDIERLNVTTKCLGNLKTLLAVRDVYADIDVAVVPSRQENLSNTVLEAMSCGKPVVAYDVGGMGDMISHKVNGYLARPFDVIDFARGIEFCAENAQELGKNARKTIIENFSMETIGKQYVDLIKNMCCE